LDSFPAGAAESDKLILLVLSEFCLCSVKEFSILWVTSGPAGFNVVDAKLCEAAGDFEFIVGRCADGLALCAVCKV
jgi:hypothetical protein